MTGDETVKWMTYLNRQDWQTKFEATQAYNANPFLPFAGAPCVYYSKEHKFMVDKSINSPNIIFGNKLVRNEYKGIPLPTLHSIVGELNNLKPGYPTLSPVLPSIATKCSDYTTMRQCMVPVTNPLTDSQKQKFRKNIILAAKKLNSQQILSAVSSIQVLSSQIKASLLWSKCKCD